MFTPEMWHDRRWLRQGRNMKKSVCFSFAAVTLLSLFASSARAEKITFLEHQKEVNKVLCKCNKEKEDPLACEKKLNAISSANANNAKVKIDDINSAICVGYLEASDCAVITAETTQGPCALKELQK